MSWRTVAAVTGTKTGVHSTRWRWVAAIWVACGLVDASQTVLFMHAVGKHAWLPIFRTELASWLPWVLATPLVINLARRHPIRRGTTVPTAAVHLAALVTVSLAAEAWFAVLQVLGLSEFLRHG
jgi:two-component system, LytTR family, sensor kinase